MTEQGCNMVYRRACICALHTHVYIPAYMYSVLLIMHDVRDVHTGCGRDPAGRACCCEIQI